MSLRNISNFRDEKVIWSSSLLVTKHFSKFFGFHLRILNRENIGLDSNEDETIVIYCKMSDRIKFRSK